MVEIGEPGRPVVREFLERREEAEVAAAVGQPLEPLPEIVDVGGPDRSEDDPPAVGETVRDAVG